VVGFLRRDRGGNPLVFVCNFSGVKTQGFRLGMPAKGTYKAVLSTDDAQFGGGGLLPSGSLFKTDSIPWHNQDCSIAIELPPLSAVFLRRGRNVSPQAISDKEASITKTVK
jgi:1,4-alpha-glucan branching enzyme